MFADGVMRFRREPSTFSAYENQRKKSYNFKAARFISQVSKQPSVHKTDKRPAWKVRLHRLIHRSWFDFLMSTLIVGNLALFGIEVEYVTQHAVLDAPSYFQHISDIFSFVFVVELVLRLAADDILPFLFDDSLWILNWLDILVVGTSIMEAVFANLHSAGPNLGYIKIVRVARTARILRVVRLVRFFRSLRILLYSVVNTLRSLAWTLLLLLTIIYVFGIVFTHSVAQHCIKEGCPSDGHMNKLFGNLKRSMITLFCAITGGDDWRNAFEALLPLNVFWQGCFLIFISFMFFAVLNVVTGVFCQSAIQSAQTDQDMVIEAMVKSKQKYIDLFAMLFESIDTDSVGKISLSQFEEGLRDPEVQAYFASLDITVDEAYSLFKLIDVEDTHVIDIDTFVSGCLRLRGSAKSIDIAMLMYETRWTQRRFMRCIRDVEAQMGFIWENISFHGLTSKRAPARSPPSGELRLQPPQAPKPIQPEQDGLPVAPRAPEEEHPARARRPSSGSSSGP